MAPPKKQEKKAAGNVPPQVFEEWLHAKFTEKNRETWEHFVRMADAHQGGRSAFIRWLIDREWARRATGPLTLPADAPVSPDAEARQQNGAHWVGKDFEGKEGDQEPGGDEGEQS